MALMDYGTPASPDAILSRREERAELLEGFSLEYSGQTLICVKLNIPGPVKQSPCLDRLFDHALSQAAAKVNDARILDIRRDVTGPEAVLVTPMDARKVKRLMVCLEEDSPAGRIYDLDVMGDGRAVSREVLGLAQRRCLLCAKSARICARSRAHSVPELLRAMEKLIKQDPELACLLAAQPGD